MMDGDELTGNLTSDDHVEDRLAAYALGSLEEQETLQVTAHLDTCRQCQIALEEYQSVVDLLPLSVPVTDPPPGLGRRLMGSLEAAPSAPESRRRARWLGLFQRPVPAWGLVGLLLVFLLVAFNVSLWGRLRALEMASRSTLQVVTLVGTGNTPDATGLMIVGGDGMVGTLVVDKLPELSTGLAYQVWLVHDGERESGGVFTVDEIGYGLKYIHSERPLLSYTSYGITIEPEEGSPGPTGDKVLGIDL